MIHEFTLILSVPDVTEEQCSALYEAGCDDGTISSSQGVTRFEFARESPTLEDAIRSAIGNVHSVGLTVVRAEIAADHLAVRSRSLHGRPTMVRESRTIGKSLRRCPTCGSERIRSVVGDYRTRVQGDDVAVPDLQRDECPDCGEVLFSPAAMRRMESYRKNPVKAG